MHCVRCMLCGSVVSNQYQVYHRSGLCIITDNAKDAKIGASISRRPVTNMADMPPTAIPTRSDGIAPTCLSYLSRRVPVLAQKLTLIIGGAASEWHPGQSGSDFSPSFLA
jgi:hypothetical protein